MPGVVDRDALLEEARVRSDRGDFEGTIATCARVLSHNPRDPIALHWTAGSLLAMGRHAEAEPLLLRSIEIKPDRPEPYFHLGWLRQIHGRFDEARAAYDRGLSIDPNHEVLLRGKVDFLAFIGAHDEALETLKPWIASGRGGIETAIAFGRIAAKVGKAGEAIDLLQRHLAVPGLADTTRITALFSLARLLDKEGEYDRAFAALREGNALRRAKFDPDAHDAMVDGLIHGWRRDVFARLPRSSVDGSMGVFVMGMPRSGSTLTDQIIAAHPEGAGPGELALVPRAVCALKGLKQYAYTAVLDRPERIEATNLQARGEHVVSRLRALGEGARRVVDKQPHNFYHVPLISIMLPGSRVIWTRRDPRDTCISCYFHIFKDDIGYIYDLEHLGRAYRAHERLMEAWGELGIEIHQTQYESLVSEQEATSRALIAAAGLDWHEDCLRYYESGRVVITSSSDQVNKPIYTSSVGRWKHYEEHLGPLLRGLEGRRTAVRVPETPAHRQAQQHALSGNFEAARQIAMSLARQNGSDARAIWLLAEAHQGLSQHEQALTLARHALTLAPGAAEPKFHEAFALRMLGRLDESLAAFEAGVAAHPDHIALVRGLINVLTARREFDRAWDVIRPRIEGGVLSLDLAVVFAPMAHHVGQQALAIDYVRRTLAAMNPQARAAFKAGRTVALFALARLLDAEGEYDEAFAAAAEANAIRAPRFDPDAFDADVDRLIDAWRRAGRLARDGAARDAGEVFIVGMPRGGSTLLEQILSCHPNLHGLGETDAVFRSIATRMPAGAPFLSLVPGNPALAGDGRAALARDIRGVMRSLAPGKARLIDKQTKNLFHVPVIASVLPDARLVHARRDPRDSGLSCFFHEFRGDFPMLYDLRAIGRAMATAERLGRAWREDLGIELLDVAYEDVVADQEGQTRRMLEHVGEAFDDACLRFSESERFVDTASTDQVRRPLYATSVGRYRNYERHLGELFRGIEEGRAWRGMPGPGVAGRGARASMRGPARGASLSEEQRAAMDREIEQHLATASWGAAEALVLRLLAADPERATAHYQLGVVRRFQNRTEEARAAFGRARELLPESSAFVRGTIDFLASVRQFDEAVETLEPWLTRELQGISALDIGVALARIARRTGREAEAIDLLRNGIGTTEPGDGPMRPLAGLLLAQLLDGQGEYDEAFAAAEEANRIRAAMVAAQGGRFRPEQFAQRVDALIEAWRGSGAMRLGIDTSVPSFVVGMPRSGSTLTEQVLASHPRATGIGEQATIIGVARQILAMDHPGSQGDGGDARFGISGDGPLSALPTSSWFAKRGEARAFAEQLLGHMEGLCADAGAPRCIIDKQPHNVFHVPLIHVLFPKARLYHARRDPRDAALSCFFHDFRGDFGYIYDLAHLGHFHLGIERLVGAWREIGIDVYDASYEALVADFEQQARGLVSHAGLDWHEDCLSFHENARPIHTNSAEQVNRPIYASSVGRWEHYQKHMGPLLRVLDRG